MVEYNTIILGAGISGITCAIYLKRAGIKVLLVENNVPGGQLNKANVIENFPGYLSITGSELASVLVEQVENYDIDIVYDDIKNIDYDKKELLIGDVVYKYKYLVFSTGRRERTLGLHNEDSLIGRGISLCATCDGALYRNQDVIVVGGGSSAVSETIYLSNICSKVYLIYRGSELKAEQILKDKVKSIQNVEIIYESNIISYISDNDKLSAVKLDNDDIIKASCVFLAIGHIPNSELFIGDVNNGYIIVDEFGKTSIDFVYACGDIIKKDIYQLVNASSEGALVANSIIKKEQNK